MVVRSGTEASTRRNSVGHATVAAVIVAAAALAAYLNSFSGALVLDDFATVAENESIRHLWPLGPVLSPPDAAGIGGRPFANLTFALSYVLGGLDVRGYHAFNLMLHALTALTLFGVVRRTLLRPGLRARFGEAAEPLALTVAVLWAAHPLQTAVVDYISQRTEALMALFYLLTLYCFVRGIDAAHPGSGRAYDAGSESTMAAPSSLVTSAATNRWHSLAVVVCALGMASKEVMVTAPVMVLLYDRTFVAGTWRGALRQRGWLHGALAATWLILAWLMATSHVGDRGIGFDQGVSWWSYALTESTAITHYLRLVLWPQPLVFDYGWGQVSNVSVVPALICVALVAGTLYALWRRPMFGFAACWFLLILAPTSSVIPVVQQPIAESRVYLSLAGIVGLIVMGLHHLSRRRTLMVVAGAMIVAGGLGGITFQRNEAYRTEVALWSDTIAKRPDNARAHGNLSAALLRADRVPEAIAAAKTAVAMMPRYSDAHHNLGVGLARSGHFAEAIESYELALSLNPATANTHYNLGDALNRAGRNSDAITHYETALRLDPHHAQAHNNLSVVLLQLGRVVDAVEHSRAALQLNPNFAEAHYNLGNALAQAGDFAAAMASFETAIRLDPRFAKAHNNLGALKLRAGQPKDAIAEFEAALRVNPDYAEAQKNLSIVRAIEAKRGR